MQSNQTKEEQTMRPDRKEHSIWQRFVSIFTIVASCTVMALALTACGGSDSTPILLPTVAKPGVPTSFTVTATPLATTLSATLTWSPPAVSSSVGLPTSYVIYRSTTAGTVFSTANKITEITVDPAKTTPYTYIDNTGLTAVNTYWVVSAKNAGGETPTAEVLYLPVLAPGAPTAFTATAGENVVTLQWSPPVVSATVGLPASYEIYQSTTATTAATIVDPTNFVTSVPVVTGQTVYTNTVIGLAGTTTYNFVVTAKNAAGETPSTVASAKPTGPPNPVVAGNNFSAALIFADDIGITNLPITGTWTLDPTLIDYNTGLRPLSTEAITVLPSLTVPTKIDPLYYEQKSINTWQGEWLKGGGAMQEVSAKWGDNLLSASLSSSAKIRIEMALTKALTTPMTAYTMKLLSGSGTNELQGTNGVTYNPTTAFVMATNARLIIQKFNGANLDAPVVDQALFDPAFPDGLDKLSGEIPVSGNFTYGFVWGSAPGAGTYRVTFKLDATSAFGVGGPVNHTLMKTATNGVRVSDTEVYIDITVK
jgi:hypothetical protein